MIAANANNLSTGEIFSIKPTADISHLEAASACVAAEPGAGLLTIGSQADFELLNNFLDLNCIEDVAIPIGNNILYHIFAVLLPLKRTDDSTCILFFCLVSTCRQAFAGYPHNVTSADSAWFAAFFNVTPPWAPEHPDLNSSIIPACSYILRAQRGNPASLGASSCQELLANSSLLICQRNVTGASIVSNLERVEVNV